MNKRKLQCFSARTIYPIICFTIIAIVVSPSIFKVKVTHANVDALVPSFSSPMLPQANSIDKLIDVAKKSNLNEWANFLNEAELNKSLDGINQFTIFAPNDKAFASKKIKKLLQQNNKKKLQKILGYHIIPHAIDYRNLKSGLVKTLEGHQVNIKVHTKSKTVDQAKIIQSDLKAGNAIIHVIDKVNLPSGIKAENNIKLAFLNSSVGVA